MLTKELEIEIRHLLVCRKLSNGGVDALYERVEVLLAEIDRLRNELSLALHK